MIMNVLRVIMCVLTVGGTFVTQTKLPDSEVPLWTQKIVQDFSRSRSGSSPLLLDNNRAGITFLDNKKVLVYEVDYERGRLSSRESPQISSPFGLHVSLLEAQSGKLTLTKDWGTRFHSTGVQVTTGGVLVRTGGIVKLYSPDFAQSRDLPLVLDSDGSFFTNVSASGSTIVISRIVEKQHDLFSHLDVFDANTLKIRRSWDLHPPLYYNPSISDERIAIAYGHGIALSEFGSTDWSTVLDFPKLRCAAGNGTPTMVSNELIVLRDCKEVLLLTASGKSFPLGAFIGGDAATPSTECEPYDGRISDKAAVASGARLVALTLPTLYIKKHLLSEARTCLAGLQVAVYDVVLKKRVFTVNVDPLPKNDYDFALSPDGSKLAILNDRNVSVRSVPGQSTEHADTTGSKN